MSRSQDILGLIRGIQLVASASVKTQEAYLKHLWSHSSVREAAEKSAMQTSECGKKFMSNPSQELQNVGNMLKETLERSSVVVEGIRQYTASGRSSYPVGEMEITSDTKSYSSVKNIKNLDIASITLKELENLLAEHNKMRQVSLRLDENVKPVSKSPKKAEIKIEAIVSPPVAAPTPAPTPKPPKPKIEPTSNIVNDEKQVESMLKFITNYDREPAATPIEPVQSGNLEVSK
jgi:aarF domain-containing kinase